MSQRGLGPSVTAGECFKRETTCHRRVTLRNGTLCMQGETLRRVIIHRTAGLVPLRFHTLHTRTALEFGLTICTGDSNSAPPQKHCSHEPLACGLPQTWALREHWPTPLTLTFLLCLSLSNCASPRRGLGRPKGTWCARPAKDLASLGTRQRT